MRDGRHQKLRRGFTGILAGALMLFAAAPCRAQKSQAAHGAKAGDREFAALIDRYCETWSTGDPEKPAELYAKDPDLVFYDLAPFEYHGWEEYKVGVKKAFFDSMSEGKLTRKDDLRVTRRGNLAWTTVTLHFAIVWKDKRTSDIEARHTAIWEKRGGKWLIVHEHLSAPFAS